MKFSPSSKFPSQTGSSSLIGASVETGASSVDPLIYRITPAGGHIGRRVPTARLMLISRKERAMEHSRADPTSPGSSHHVARATTSAQSRMDVVGTTVKTKHCFLRRALLISLHPGGVSRNAGGAGWWATEIEASFGQCWTQALLRLRDGEIGGKFSIDLLTPYSILHTPAACDRREKEACKSQQGSQKGGPRAAWPQGWHRVGRL